MNDPIRSLTRNLFTGSVPAVMTAAEIAPAQTGGDIRVQGTRTTLTVVAGPPLYEVTHTLIQEYNRPVTFEESVTVYPRDWVDVTRSFPFGRRSYSHRGGRLEFS